MLINNKHALNFVIIRLRSHFKVAQEELENNFTFHSVFFFSKISFDMPYIN